jgi:hypothetical protein
MLAMSLIRSVDMWRCDELKLVERAEALDAV